MRVEGLRFGVWGLGLGGGLGFIVEGLGSGVGDLWLRVYGMGCMVPGLGFR